MGFGGEIKGGVEKTVQCWGVLKGERAGGKRKYLGDVAEKTKGGRREAAVSKKASTAGSE